MFLVSPTVYEKLLTCIDEKDKKVTEDLNIFKDKKQRPSDEVIHDLNVESFNEPIEEEVQSMAEEKQQQEITPQDDQQHESDNIYQDENGEMEAIFDKSNLEINAPQNTLSSPCVRSDGGEVIPQGGLIYRPQPQQSQFKAQKKPIISIPRLSKQEIDFYTKPRQNMVFKPAVLQAPQTRPQIATLSQEPMFPKPIFKKPILSIPRLQQDEIDAFTNSKGLQLKLPKLTHKQIGVLPGIVKKKNATTNIKNFQCPTCFKFWRSKWDLKRHVSTVHSNLRAKASESVQALPDTDDVMHDQDQTNNYPAWTRTRAQKRNSQQAKLPNLKNNKFRPPGGEDDNDGKDFQSWGYKTF
jgi:uncharacterized C2H2 Zn-finger protein